MTEWKSVREDIVVDYPEYELALEEFRRGEQQMVFIHLWVRKDWSLKLLKRFDATWRLLRKHVTCPLFATIERPDDKWVKFITHFGFNPFTEAIWDGEPRQIYWIQGTQDDQFNPKTEFKFDLELKLDHSVGTFDVPDAVPVPSVRGSKRRAEHGAG